MVANMPLLISLCQESVSVPTTNANPKRDFGMLDRLMKLKYEGMRESSCLQLIIQEVGMTAFLKSHLILQWTLQESQKNSRKKYTSKEKG